MRDPLVLRAHEIRGSVRRDRGLPGAQADFEAALRAAVASADPIGQARMFGFLAHDIGLIEGRFADARLWRDLAESGLAALGPGHEEVEADVLGSLGAAALAEGDHREAARRYRRSLALTEQLWGKESIRLPLILSNLAVAVGSDESGSQEAKALLQRALSIAERAYGPDSLIVTNPLANLASELAAAGFYREALGLTRRVLAPRAEAELAAGDLAAARKAGEAGLALGNPVSDPALVGRLRFALARALIRTDPGRAIGLARQSVKDLSQGSPRTRSLRARAAAWLDAQPGNSSSRARRVLGGSRSASK